MTHLQPSTKPTAKVVWFACIIMFTLRALPLHVSSLSHFPFSRVRFPILVLYLWTQLGDSGGGLEFCQQLQLAFLIYRIIHQADLSSWAQITFRQIIQEL
jgi:hypothetical protein